MRIHPLSRAAKTVYLRSMCTVVILRRPNHPWPLIIGANRDEMIGRPWQSPARHWPDRSQTVAGLDELAGGTWLGINDYGVVAGILNRPSSLGPLAGLRSRGELPLEALEHAEAKVAAQALGDLETGSFRTFNMIVADAHTAFWLRSVGGEAGKSQGCAVEMAPIPIGLSMLTAWDLNDSLSPRVRFHLPRFQAAPPPDPESDDWFAWETLLASRDSEPDADRSGAMSVSSDVGFGTISSSLMAFPAPERLGIRPIWRFCPGRPGSVSWTDVILG